MLDTAVCQTCGARRSGAFCSACGEKAISSHDYSLLHFSEHLLESITHFDVKSLRAVRALLFQPGRLTRHYLDGRRQSYLGPVQIFAVANIAFALLIGLTHWAPFNTPLRAQATNPPFMQWKQQRIDRAIADHGLDRTEFSRRFDEAASLQSKTWVFAMIPAFALAAAALYGFRRFFFEHLVFSTHFLAFALIWTLVVVTAWDLTTPWLTRHAGLRLSGDQVEAVVSMLTLGGLAVYLFAAFRCVHGDGRVAAAVRAAALSFGLYFPIVLAYRFLLFFVTLWAMH